MFMYDGNFHNKLFGAPSGGIMAKQRSLETSARQLYVYPLGKIH